MADPAKLIAWTWCGRMTSDAAREKRDRASHVDEQFYLLVVMAAKKKLGQDVLTELFLAHGDGLLVFFVRYL